MKTEQLIAALAADTTTLRPPRAVLWPALAAAMALAVLAVWQVLGFRADLAASLADPLSALRILLTAALAVAGLRLALMLARPEGRGPARLWPVALPVALPVAAALCLWFWAWLATPGEGRQMALVGKTMVTCLLSIPLLSVLPVAAILAALRRGATTAPALAGLAAGLAGGGLAATAYATYCIEDSPLFYVTWYGLAIGGVALASSLIGARVLRW